MENQSEKLDHRVAGLPSLCLASSRIQFSVHTGRVRLSPALTVLVAQAIRLSPGVAIDSQVCLLVRYAKDGSSPRLTPRLIMILTLGDVKGWHDGVGS